MTGCKLCGEGLVRGEKRIRIDSFELGDTDGMEGVAMYHARCFMDIVNMDDMPVARTDIIEGNVEKRDGEIYSPTYVEDAQK